MLSCVGLFNKPESEILIQEYMCSFINFQLNDMGFDMLVIFIKKIGAIAFVMTFAFVLAISSFAALVYHSDFTLSQISVVSALVFYVLFFLGLVILKLQNVNFGKTFNIKGGQIE